MKKKRIMVVDDDREFLTELQETLELNGYEVLKVNNPAHVLDKAGDSRPDVIILDLKMEHRNGFELADELSRFTKTLDIPVIAMTGFFTEDEHRSLMNICGIQKCITKPFRAEDLIAAIESEIKNRQ